MKQFWLQVILLLIVIFGGLYITTNQSTLNGLFKDVGLNSPPNPAVVNKLRVVDGSEASVVKAEINIEIANTPDSRTRGLGGRQSLDQNSGMLFILENRGVPNFWMKGMKISLDFIWIDQDTVVDILPNAQPPEEGQSDDTLARFAPVKEITQVLEVNAGFAESKNIKVGDKIQILGAE